MQHGEPMPEEVQAKSEEPDEEQRLFVITEKHRHLDRRCPCSAVQGLCVIEGYPTIGRASAVFSTATAVPSPWQAPRPRLLGSICCAMARLTLDDSLSAFDLLGFPEIDRALFAAKSHFFYFGHVTFHSWVVANTSMLAFVVTVPPPLAGLVAKSWVRGAAIHAKRHPCQLSLSSTMTATS